MVNINLLPWRMYERKYQLRIIKIIFLLIFFINTAFCCLIYFVLAKHVQIAEMHLREKETQYNQYMQESKSFIKRNIVQGFPLIQTMLDYRRQTWKWLTLIGSNRNTAFCFTEIKRNRREILVTGKTYSINELLEYLRYWQTLPFFSSVKLIYLNHKEVNWSFRFLAKEKDVFRKVNAKIKGLTS